MSTILYFISNAEDSGRFNLFESVLTTFGIHGSISTGIEYSVPSGTLATILLLPALNLLYKNRFSHLLDIIFVLIHCIAILFPVEPSLVLLEITFLVCHILNSELAELS